MAENDVTRNDQCTAPAPGEPALGPEEGPRRSGEANGAETVAYPVPGSDPIGPHSDSGREGAGPEPRCHLPDLRAWSPMPRVAWGKSTGPSIGSWDVRSR